MPVNIDPDDDRPIARICRVVNVMEALPYPPSDNAPLRNVLPGAWPTYGDLKQLAAEHFGKAAQKRSNKKKG